MAFRWTFGVAEGQEWSRLLRKLDMVRLIDHPGRVVCKLEKRDVYNLVNVCD